MSLAGFFSNLAARTLPSVVPVLQPPDTSLDACHPSDRERRVDVVFVHGLKGSPRDTWTGKTTDDGSSTFWPEWIAEDATDAGVWLCHYPTTVVDWFSTTLPIASIAGNLAHRMRNQGIGERPVIFVGHSMGGLVVKHMLCDAAINANPELKRLWLNTIGVAFIATPHLGSDVASMKSVVQWLLQWMVGSDLPGDQSTVDELEAGARPLLELNRAFTQHVTARHDRGALPRIVVYREMLPTLGALVVGPDRGDPNIAKAELVDLPMDHLEACKLADRKGSPFEWVMRQLSHAPPAMSLPEGRIFVCAPSRLGQRIGDDDRLAAFVAWMQMQGFSVDSERDYFFRRAPDDWRVWRESKLKQAHTVLVLGHPDAVEAFESQNPQTFTGATLTHAEYERHARPASRFIPVLLDDDPVSYLPGPLQGRYAGHRFPQHKDHLRAAICSPVIDI